MKGVTVKLILIVIVTLLIACNQAKENNVSSRIPIKGTWRLYQGIVIERKDTTVTDYTGNTSFIKVINDNHFAFLHHDLKKGKTDSPVFGAGGGSYSLRDSLYTEHLEYCSDRQWEGNDFTFAVTIKNDTLIQRGVEKIESAGVDRVNIEKYVRVKQ